MQVPIGSDMKFTVIVLSNCAESPHNSRLTDSSCFSSSLLKKGEGKKNAGRWKRGGNPQDN